MCRTSAPLSGLKTVPALAIILLSCQMMKGSLVLHVTSVGVSRVIALKTGILKCDHPGAPKCEDWWVPFDMLRRRV